MERKHFLWGCGIIFAVALILRVVTAILANAEAGRTIRPDTDGYLTPALSLCRDGSYAGTRRPPGFPLLAAAVFKCGGGEKALSFVLAVLSSLALFAVFRAGQLCAGEKGALLAGGLYALNPTALGNAPLLLSDSWAALFAAVQFWLFMEFYRKQRWPAAGACALVAGWGALIRPVNSLFILPLLVLIWLVPHGSLRKKAAWSAGALLLFSAVIFPWMLRNAGCGAGFCIDTNTGAMYHQNGAMLSGEVTGRGYEFEKQRIISEQEELFKDTARFPDEKSREEYRISCYKELVKKHWPTWLKQQCNYQILLPDIPSLMECAGVTNSDRGTMAVLKEQGILAAVHHYFGEKWFYLLLPVIPLLLVALFTMAGTLLHLWYSLAELRKGYMELFIFGAFVFYYLFLPGAITAPRYQLPALPCLCVMAAMGSCELLNRIRPKVKDE